MSNLTTLQRQFGQHHLHRNEQWHLHQFNDMNYCDKLNECLSALDKDQPCGLQLRQNAVDWLLSSQYQDFSDLHLHDVVLSQANLKRCNFCWVNAENCDMSNVNLSNSDLTSGNFAHAYFAYADLTSAYCKYARLDSADLFGATLQFANLDSASLYQADLSEANLSKADLGYADFSGADLYKCNLSMTNLQQTNINRTNLELAYLGNCKNLLPEQLSESTNIKNICGLNKQFLEEVHDINHTLLEWWDGTSREMDSDEWHELMHQLDCEF